MGVAGKVMILCMLSKAQNSRKRHGNSAMSSSNVLDPVRRFTAARVGSPGPYRDPGIGGVRNHSVSAAPSLHSGVDASWKFEMVFTQPCSIIEQGFVVTGVLYLLWFVGSAICTITFIFSLDESFKAKPL